MFEKLRKANWIICIYDSLTDVFVYLHKCFLSVAFIFFVGFIYNLELNPILGSSSADENIVMFIIALGFCLICWVIHLLFVWFPYGQP